jgi:hypothetical protein
MQAQFRWMEAHTMDACLQGRMHTLQTDIFIRERIWNSGRRRMKHKKLAQDMIDKISELAQCAAKLGVDTDIIMQGVRHANIDLVLREMNAAEAQKEFVIRECIESVRQSINSGAMS